MVGHKHNAILRPRELDVFPGSWAVGSLPAPRYHHRHLFHRRTRSSASAPTARDGGAFFGATPGEGSRDSAAGLDDEVESSSAKVSEKDDEVVPQPRDSVLIAPTDSWTSAVRECFVPALWMDPRLWMAGLVEFASSMAFAFVTGSIGVTVSTYPGYVVGPSLFVANTAVVSLFIFAISTSTGAHINPIISIATMFTGLCHPIRSIIYVVCQAAGSCIGGAFLRAGLGRAHALQVHNGGCWLDPNGPMTVGQAAAIEFMGAFSLLLISFGVGLDPRQKQLYGAALGPLLVGMTVGIITSATSALSPGYTGAGIFPGRCLGLQVGIGHFEKHDWVWWIPDIAAAVLHAIMYNLAPPYTREVSCPRLEKCRQKRDAEAAQAA